MPSLPESNDGERELAPAPISPSELDFAAVARISTQAELKGIRLTFLHADMDESKGAIPDDWSADSVIGFNTEGQLDRESNVLRVICVFVAVWAPGLDDEPSALPDPKDAPLELHARYELAYELKDAAAVQRADPEHFALSNGVLHAWPYWREIAHSTTSRMGLAPLLVGTFKIPWTGDPARTPQHADEPPSDQA